MTTITVQVPDPLAQRIQPMRPWLSAVLELSLVGFRTRAVETAGEIIAFLSSGPSVSDVINYHVSERAQERLRRLLALNAGRAISLEEQAELNEIEQIEHIIIMLKAQAHKGMVRGS